MTEVKLLLSLLACIPQDSGDLEALLRQLGSDRIEEREEAVEKISKLPVSSLPELKKRAEALEGEPKLLLQSAMREVEARRRLPAFRGVTLDVTDAPVHEVLAEVARQTGFPLEYGRVRKDGRITVRLRDATPIQALDTIAEAGMLGWRGYGFSDWRGRQGYARSHASPNIRVWNMTRRIPRLERAHYGGHYKVSIAENVDIRTKDGKTSLSARLSLKWSPGVRPCGFSAVTIHDLRDERGRTYSPEMGRGRGTYRSLFGRQGITYALPLAGVDPLPRRIARLSGSVTVLYPRKILWVSFENPSGAIGQAQRLGEVQVTLAEYRRTGKTHAATLNVTPNRMQTLSMDPEKLPVYYGDVELVTASGEALHSDGMTGFGGKGGWSIIVKMHGSKAEPAKEIRIPWFEETLEDKVTFELRDVPLGN